jgi:cytochrome c oxidase subunit IV
VAQSSNLSKKYKGKIHDEIKIWAMIFVLSRLSYQKYRSLYYYLKLYNWAIIPNGGEV